MFIACRINQQYRITARFKIFCGKNGDSVPMVAAAQAAIMTEATNFG